MSIDTLSSQLPNKIHKYLILKSAFYVYLAENLVYRFASSRCSLFN